MTGARGWLARWYEALWPVPPREVRALRPSEVASIFGWDTQEDVRPVPLDLEHWEPPRPPPPEVVEAYRRQQAERGRDEPRVVTHGG